MKLKTATILAAVSLIIWLIIGLSQWVLFSFNFVSYSDLRWVYAAIGLIQMLLYSVPMIIFFIVLYSKQKGQQNGTGNQQDS